MSKSLTLLVHVPTSKDFNFPDGKNINLICLGRTAVTIGSVVGWNMAWSQDLHFGGLSGQNRRVSG